MDFSKEQQVRRFSRVGHQRLDDAKFLFDPGNRYTASVYLAGYAVECALKALLLNGVAKGRFGEVMDSFRGKEGHSFEALKARYYREGGMKIPPEIARALTVVSGWTTDLRHEPGVTSPKVARAFLQAAEEIITWSSGRI